MRDWITEHVTVLWAVGVLLFTVVMLVGTKWSLGLLQRKWRRSSEYDKVFSALQRVLRTFFVLFGIGLFSYLFVGRESYAFVSASLGRVIWIALILVIMVVGSAFISAYFDNRVRRLSQRDRGDATAYKYVGYLSRFGIYAFGSILIAIAFPTLRDFAASALAGAGVFALVAGVAAQEAIANIIGGLFIVFFKPFRIGDVIRIGDGIVGRVEDIDLRQTIINDFQNMRVVIPNAVINQKNITNYFLRESKVCEWVEIGISYDSDLQKAMTLMQEVSEAHPSAIDNRSATDKERGAAKVDVQVVKLDESSVNLRAWVWCADYLSGFRTRNDLFKAIKLRFDAEAIEIPFPHRTLVFKPGGPTGFPQ